MRTFVAKMFLLAFMICTGAKVKSQCEIVGYYPGWTQVSPTSIDYKKYTIINYAFYVTTEAGGVIDFDGNGPRLIPQIVSSAHAAGTKVVISVGGWNHSWHFPGIAADAGKRRKFAQDCASLISQFNLDGIDIDWEYPGYEAHGGGPADKENYNLLMKDIRAAIGTNKLLTAAVGAGPDKISWVDYKTIGEVLDIINLMSYDFYGTWDKVTNHNSALYPAAEGDENLSWSKAYKNMVYAGVPGHKITMGVAFYGRSQGCVGTPGLHVEGTGAAATEFTGLNYNQIKPIIGTAGVTRHWDDKAKVPYLTKGKGFLSYDDEESMGLKADFVRQNGAGGVIIWEITGDMIGGSTPLADVLYQKLKVSPSCIVGKSEKELGKIGLEIMPNPNNGSFELEIGTGLESDINLSVANLLGEVVYQEVFNTTIGLSKKSLNLPKLKDGIYFITLSNGVGSKSKKFVKN